MNIRDLLGRIDKEEDLQELVDRISMRVLKYGKGANKHAGTHRTGGADELDGDKLDIDYTPSNYTPATTPSEADNADNLTAHLYGIDAELGQKLENVVEDTTPQLGGDLDLNSHGVDFPTTANITDCLDEDDMSSNSATSLATQQSIKAYADTKLADVVDDTSPQLGGDLDLNGNAIDFPTTADIADCLDEDDMASNSAVSLATQQSIKAYVDTQVASAAMSRWRLWFGA